MSATNRLKEPSTYAGVAALAVLFGASATEAHLIAEAVGAVAAVLAILLPESRRA